MEEQSIKYAFDIIAALGAIAVITSIIYALKEYIRKEKVRSESGLHLRLNIQQKDDKNLILLKTEVENKTEKSIKVDNAFLLLNKQGIAPSELMKRISGKESTTLDFRKLDVDDIIKCDDIIYIPLKYYINGGENDDIGNETLRFVYPLETEESGDETVWEVRFYIFPDHRQDKFHRSVHSAFKSRKFILNQ